MDKVIKAIPTKYRGIQFRSRLEARWAVFWEHLLPGCWSYENFGSCNGGSFLHMVSSGIGFRDMQLADECNRYCPDFRIEMPCNAVLFQEVKPVRPNFDYMQKMRWTAAALGTVGYPLLLTVGAPCEVKDGKLTLEVFLPPYSATFCRFGLDWFSRFDTSPQKSTLSQAAAISADYRFDLPESSFANL